MILELNDFSGGVTDYYLNAPENKLRKAINLLIATYPGMGKPFTRPGSRLYDASNPRIEPAGRINNCFWYKNNLVVHSGKNLFFYDESVSTERWKKVDVHGKGYAFPNFDGDSRFSHAFWNYHTLIVGLSTTTKKLVKGVDGKPFVMEAGLPKPQNHGCTFAGQAETSEQGVYLFKLAYERRYTTFDGIEFLDVSHTSDIFQFNKMADSSTVTLTFNKNFTDFNSGAYDLSTIKIAVYRTILNGDVFYRQTDFDVLENKTISIDLDDSLLTSNEVLYTTGSDVENAIPPRSLTVHVKNDIAYYGHIIPNATNGTKINYRLMQSVPGDIDSVPEDFFVDLDDEIICISSTKSNVIVMCKDSTYRIDGAIDGVGRGDIVAERISDTASCISPYGAVQAMDGVFWLGKDGVYFTDGFKVLKVNADYDKSYKDFVLYAGKILDSRTHKFSGRYDRRKNRIWWNVSSIGASEVDMCYVLDLNWGVSDKATFTTISGDSFYPTAIEFIDGNLIRCDKLGYVLVHEYGLYSDPKIEHTKPVSSWSEEAILFDFETIAINFGTSATRKYVSQVNVTCDSETNLSMDLISNSDDGLRISDLAPIRYRGKVLWGDEDLVWGDPNIVWNKRGLVHEKRRMSSNAIRCNYKSINLKSAKLVITNSDLLGKASVNLNGKLIVLKSAGKRFPNKSVGYFITLVDNITKKYRDEFEILAVSGDTITVSDPNNLLAILSLDTVNGNEWVIRGYPKNEILNLLNISLVYELSGPTQQAFTEKGTGEVAK